MTIFVSPSGAKIKTCDDTTNPSMIQHAGKGSAEFLSKKDTTALGEGDTIFFVNKKHAYTVVFPKVEPPNASSDTPAKISTKSPAKQQGTLASFMKKRPASEMSSSPARPQKKERKLEPSVGAQRALASSSMPTAAEMNGSGANIKAASRLAGAGHNQEMCRPFSDIAEIYRVMGDTTRHRTYSKAVKGMKCFGQEITSGKQAKAIDGVGAKIAAKIDEYLQSKAKTGTGVVKKLVELNKDPKVQGALVLNVVHGIGPKFAQMLMKEHNICSLEDLREHVEETEGGETDSWGRECLLDSTQKLGLRLADEFQQRIPRDEVAKIEQKLKEISRSIDPRLNLTICGSYRRGNMSSGDVDCLVCHPDHKPAPDKWKVSDQKGAKVQHNRFLQALVTGLTQEGLVTDDISHGPTKYMGVIQLQPDPSSTQPALHRRLDLRVVPWQCYHFSTLYFTGSDDTNVEMRDEAIKLGMGLSEYGLTDTKTKKYINVAEEFDSEEAIFKRLNMAYREPSQR
jgi:DNA polymerase beta